MARDRFPYVEVSMVDAGSSYELGRRIGAALHDQVAHCLTYYRQMFADYSDLEWSRACELAKRFVPAIEAYGPEYLEEMRGIADGAGCAFEDILALNCRSELVFVGRQADAVEGGCTSIGVTPEATHGGRTLLAQNWDWKPIADAMAVVRITHGDSENGIARKPDILMVTEAGIIGKIGCNSAGLGVCLNALSTDQAPAGLPLHIALRGILESSTIHEAIGAATKMPLGCCANFIVATAEGECVSIEAENEDFDVLYPRDGVIVHTNHFMSPRLPLPPRKDSLKRKVADTFVRAGRAEKLLRARMAKSGVLGEQDVRDVLQDHVELPHAICRHENAGIPEGLRMVTVFSAIMNLQAGELWLCEGNPCEGVYRKFAV